MKRYTKYCLSLAVILIFPSFFGNVGAVIPDDWGVTEDTTLYYTGGFDLDINLPQPLWDELNASLWDMMNNSYSASVAAEFDAKSIIEGITELPTVINFEIDVTNMDTIRENETDYWVDYDIIDVTIKAKLAADVGAEYLPLENFTLNYAEDYIIPFIDAEFPTVMAENFTAEFQAELDHQWSTFGGVGYEYLLDNLRLTNWADDTNYTFEDDGDMGQIQELVFDSLGIFDNGGSIPLLVQKDADLGVVFEELKDEVNRLLLQNNLLYIGGFNGFLEELGVDLIVSEKEVYTAWDIDSPKDIFGAVLDAAKIVGVDVLNEEVLGPQWNISALDDSFYAGFEAGIRWDSEGIMQNMHFELEAGVDFVGTDVFGIKLTIDLSEGEVSSLNSKFTGKPTNPTVYEPKVQDDWGVTEGSRTEFTSGYDVNLELPQAVWDLLDTTVIQLLNETEFNITEGEEFSSEQFYDSLMDNIPRVINFESYITDMFNIELEREEWNGSVDEDVIANFDVLVSQFRTKLPEETAYRPPLTMVGDMYDGLMASLTNGLPTSLGENITNMIEELQESLINSTGILEGYDLNLLDIASQVVPSIPFYWGTSGNSTSIPAFANGLGVFSESWVEIIGNLYAMPSLLYIPKDVDLGAVYEGFDQYMIDEGEFEAGDLESFFQNMSVDRFEVSEKMIYLEWDIDGLDDIFWNTTGGIEGINALCQGFEEVFDVELLNDSIYMTATAVLRYDDNGILQNLHTQFGAEMTTNTSEKLSFETESDLSQGAWKKINEKFYGEPLIEIYDHWVDPDDQFTLYFGAGADQELVLESEEYDVSVTFDYSATVDGTLSIQVWTENPSEGEVDYTGPGLYFAVDVSDENALTMPITITVELPADVLALTDDEILLYFQIYSLDEATDEWGLENFTKTVDRTSGTVNIDIDHLSVFSVGYIAPEGGTNTGTDTGTGGTDTGTGGTEDPGFGIPGYTPIFVLFASLGAITLIIKKRK